MEPDIPTLRPTPLLVEYSDLVQRAGALGPVLDLACGQGQNGIFLAGKNVKVTCCDVSWESLKQAEELAGKLGVHLRLWQVDLEREGVNPLPIETYGAVIVFRYLHRPLIPCIRKALKKGGILVYETFTSDQIQFGKPHNPDHLLRHGELRGWFDDWEIIHSFEGIMHDPSRAMAQIVCRKTV